MTRCDVMKYMCVYTSYIPVPTVYIQYIISIFLFELHNLYTLIPISINDLIVNTDIENGDTF